MTQATFDIDYEIENNTLRINDLAAAGNVAAMHTPDTFTRALLLGLIEEFESLDAIIVNTSCMSHIDPLEATGYTILEDESDEHFVTAEYELHE